MSEKTKSFLARNKLYWLYMPLFWVMIVAVVLVLTNGKAIVPFIYRTI
jgi:hypothetical protein